MTCGCLLFACSDDPNCPVGTEIVGSQCRPLANRPDGGATNQGMDVGRDGGPCVANDAACNGRDTGCDGSNEAGLLTNFYLDADGDGYGQGAAVLTCRPPTPQHTQRDGDCDDTCATCYPGADEAVCDGKDNNCDGSIDEGLGQTYYRDADSDHFGDKNVTTTACNAPAGYVSDQTDCDDDCPTCNPLIPTDTTCDGKDDDCNGVADQAATVATYYRDCDGDTLAASTLDSVSSCAAPAASGGCAWTTKIPAAADSTDCNDGNAEVHPGQATYFTTKIAGAAVAADFDYNCNGAETREKFLLCADTPCETGRLCVKETLPACGDTFELFRLSKVPDGLGDVHPCWPVPSTKALGCR